MMHTILNPIRATEEIPMKTVYVETISDMIDAGMPVVYLDADLMLSLGAVPAWQKHPDRIFNCGIAEANMMGVAAGLSCDGLVPFIHTFGPFASRRIFDQVFVSGAYANLNVKIIGSDPGICTQLNGGTHCAFEDTALMRTIPGMTILEPTDNAMLKAMLYQAATTYGMFYIRMPRFAVEKIYDDASVFDANKAVMLRDGKDVSLLASGLEVSEALGAADILQQKGISARVIDMAVIKPLDYDIVLKAANETGAIVTAENHSVVGGLGGAVAEFLAKNRPTPMEFIGSLEEFGQVGPLNWQRTYYHLKAEDIANAAYRVIARK